MKILNPVFRSTAPQTPSLKTRRHKRVCGRVRGIKSSGDQANTQATNAFIARSDRVSISENRWWGF
jgi:hypothetical protein